MRLGWIRSSVFRNRKVENPWAEHLGRVRGVVGDLDSGAIACVVVAYSGCCGLGGKWFAVPADALKLTFDDRRAFLAVHRSTLARLPGCARGARPDAPDPELVAALLEPRLGRQL